MLLFENGCLVFDSVPELKVRLYHDKLVNILSEGSKTFANIFEGFCVEVFLDMGEMITKKNNGRNDSPGLRAIHRRFHYSSFLIPGFISISRYCCRGRLMPTCYRRLCKILKKKAE